MHLADLESDFSVYHRIDDIQHMPSRKFCRLAYRIGVYPGVIANLAAEAEKEREESGNSSVGVTADPGFNGLIEHSTTDARG